MEAQAGRNRGEGRRVDAPHFSWRKLRCYCASRGAAPAPRPSRPGARRSALLFSRACCGQRAIAADVADGGDALLKKVGGPLAGPRVGQLGPKRL